MRFTPQDEEFRAEVRAWLEASLTGEFAGLRGAGGPGREHERHDERLAWNRHLAAAGWTCLGWPAEHGGRGATLTRQVIFYEEYARAGAPARVSIVGEELLGPTLLAFGTPDQQQRFLPPIRAVAELWCQGYSEPGAGSDLASVATRAALDGDNWVINGQKTWTSGAQYSDWCGALVRTDFSVKKHDGISFMLIDMHQDAIEPRPIALIAGASPFCETFFTDAKAPKENLLGKLNEGWSVGKRLLQHERASQTGASMGGRQVPLNEIAKRYCEVDAQGRLVDTDLRTRLTRHLMDARIHGLTLARVAAESKEASGATNGASVLKNSATVVSQTRAELTLEIMGAQGLGWQGDTFNQEEIETVRGWLSGKAMSIYGGSAEIQNNIISKRILGLPDNTQST